MLNEQQLYNTVCTITSRVLQELASPVLWHFCWLDNLQGILSSNSFKLSQSDVDREVLPGVTGYSSRRNYYFCATRSKNSSEGYSRIVSNDNWEGYARLTLDGDALNSITHTKASDYFGSREGVSTKATPNSMVEKEDTIWYNKPEIKNFSKYIKRIDVMIPMRDKLEYPYEGLVEIDEMARRLGIPLFFYRNIPDFDKQNNNTVPVESLKEQQPVTQMESIVRQVVDDVMARLY